MKDLLSKLADPKDLEVVCSDCGINLMQYVGNARCQMYQKMARNIHLSIAGNNKRKPDKSKFPLRDESQV
jgi:predicted ATP-dependent serine protease